MVYLEALLQSPENGYGVLNGRLLHHDGLEAALKGGVLFYVLAVLVDGGGADAVELAPGQHGFEHVAGVNCALGLTCTHNCVQFVYEEQYPSVALLDLVQHGLEAFLKLAPVLGARKERPHVESEDGAILQTFRHIAPDYALGKPFHDGGLAYAWLANKDRVVLGFSTKDPDNPSDLLVTAYDGIELTGPCHGHQVATIPFKGFVGILGVGALDPLAPSYVLKNLQE